MKSWMILLAVLAACSPAQCDWTQAQFQQAIDAAAASGQCVVIPPNNTIVITSTVNVAYSNACIEGSGPTSVLKMSGPGLTRGLFIGGPAFVGPVNLAVTTAETQTVFTLVSGGVATLGLQVGDYVYFDDIFTDSYGFDNPHREVSRVVSIQGDAITIQDPAYETFDVANGARVTKIPELSNVRVSNLKVAGDTVNPPALNGSAIYARTVDSDFSMITGEDIPGSVLTLSTGYNNRVRYITAIRSGSGGANDIEILKQTGFHVSNLSSQMSTGFGPGIDWSNGGTARNIVVTDITHGRGFKLMGSTYNVFSNIQVHHTNPIYTGFAVAPLANRNMFTNLVSLTHGQTPLWIVEDDFNMFANVRARFAYGDNGNGQDIQVFAPSTGNIFLNTDYGSLYDQGTGTVFK